MAIYAVLPRGITLAILGGILVIIGAVEWLRLKRPEINAWFLGKFNGLHRESEIVGPSGIFWTLLGSWVTMVVFTNKRIVLAAIGMMAFGDAAAALAGKKWGTHRWSKNPPKTIEGSAAFAAISAAWALLFVRWPVAILSALTAAWVESQPFQWNDNFWVPLLGGAALSVFNLLLGRH